MIQPKKQKWVIIDPKGLSSRQAKAYTAYVEADKQEKEKRRALEASLQEGVPAGKVLKTSLKWGKLQVILMDRASLEQEKGQTSKEHRMSLDEYLAQAE